MKTGRRFIVLAALLLTSVSLFVVAHANQGHHQSGIIGHVEGLPTFVDRCRVHITSSDGGKLDLDVLTDTNLAFAVALKPGIYTVVPYVVSVPPISIPPGSPVVVRAERKNMKQVTLIYSPRPQ